MPDATRLGKRWLDVGSAAEAEAVGVLGGIGRAVSSAVTLLASAVRTTSGTGSDVVDQTIEDARALLFVLDVTAQSGTTPTLDAAVQAKIGSLYYNLARFAQVGAATDKRGVTTKRFLAQATALTLEADPAVGTGLLVADSEWQDILRVKWTIAGTTPSYTFSVVTYPVK